MDKIMEIWALTQMAREKRKNISKRVSSEVGKRKVTNK
jgi:hypothetical protein